jgi:hypothetical protein
VKHVTLGLVATLLVAAPAAPAAAKPLTIGVISDVNGSACQTKYPSNSLTALKNLLTKPLTHVIMPGDATHGECMSYKGSAPYQEVAQGMWKEFEEKFHRPVRASGAELVLSPGNHDAPYLSSASRAGFRTENQEFVRYWQSQQPRLAVKPLRISGAPDKFPYYWAYTQENVLYIVLQSTRTHSLSNASEQKKWLKAVLQSPEAKAARARIAYGHVPPYGVLDPSVGSKAKEIIENEQVGESGGLVDLLLDLNVNLLVTGHSHAPFPGELTRKKDGRKLKILSMPCGHAPRKLVGKSALAPRGYAVLTLADDNALSIAIHNYSDGKKIPSSYFPAEIPLKDPRVKYLRADTATYP